jgi:glutamate synthase (NADPH/NADH) small chain
MDITRSMARLQKEKYGKVNVVTTCLEDEAHMPADDEEVIEAREEGAVITPAYGPQSIEIENSEKLKGLHVSKCLSIFDDEGRFNPQYDKSDSKFYEADMIVESIGQASDLTYLPKNVSEKIEYNNRRQIVSDGDFQVPSTPWLFVGGDISQGPDVIHGIANGHHAAKGIDAFIRKGKP